MNKRANLYMNIGEFLFLALAILFMNFYLTYTNINFFFRNSFFLFGAVMGLTFIAIECFLFILMNMKTRIAYSAFLLVDVILAVYINLIIPFSCPIVLLTLCLLKNVLRIILVDKLYIPREFNYYCRLLGFKVKDFKKKKVIKKVEKKKEIIEIPVEAKEKKTKRGRKTTKSVEETA